MSVHVYGDTPVDLLKRVRPGEDDAIKQYRLDNYEPTTKGPCGKAIDIVSKIFNPNLSSIVFPQTDNADLLKEYTMEYYPEYNSIMSFNKDVTLKKMIADANALMVVKPKSHPESDQERAFPIVMIYSSDVVWDWDDEHYLLFIAETKESGKTRFTFDYVDNQSILRFEAVNPRNSQEGIQITILEEYFHNFVDQYGVKEIPAWRLRGNALPTPDGRIVYESFFSNAKANWNYAIIHESDVLGAFTKHTHPQRWMVGEECTNAEMRDGVQYRCSNGILRNPGLKTAYPCNKCGGSGRMGGSPYEDFVITRKKLEDGTMTAKPVGYVEVPVEATKLLSDRVDAMIMKGNAAINMDVEDKVGENQSGIAKVYDRSAQNNIIFAIGTVMFDIHVNTQLYFINKYLFGTEAKSTGKQLNESLPQVNKPTQFNIETTSEIIAGFKISKEAGVDRNFLQAKQIELFSRDMETNPDLKRYYIAIVNLDPLFAMTQDEIDSNVSQGFIRKVDVVIHSNLKPFVDRAIAEDHEFINLPKEEQFEKIETYAAELLAKEQPKVTMQFPPVVA